MAIWTEWASKPPQGTLLDPTNNLNTNLTCCITLNEGSGTPIDVAMPAYKPTFSGSPTWGAGPFGSYLSVSTSNFLVIPNRGVDWALNIPFTFRMLFYPTVYGGSGFAALFDTTNRDLTCFVGATGTVSDTGEGGANGTVNPVLGVTVGSWWDLMWTSINTSSTAATTTVYINGKPNASTIPYTSMATHLDNLTIGGNPSTGGAGATMFVALIQYWQRILTPGEILSLYKNPWQNFVPPFPFWWGHATAAASGYFPETPFPNIPPSLLVN